METRESQPNRKIIRKKRLIVSDPRNQISIGRFGTRTGSYLLGACLKRRIKFPHNLRKSFGHMAPCTLIQWLWEETYDQNVFSSNPGIASDASFPY